MNASLHVERAVLEYDADKLEKDKEGGEAPELAGIGRAQDLADAVAPEEAESFL